MGDECTGDLEAPTLAAAVAAHRATDELGKPERSGDLLDPRLAGLDTPQTRVDLEVSPPGERPVHNGLLEHDAAH